MGLYRLARPAWTGLMHYAELLENVAPVIDLSVAGVLFQTLAKDPPGWR